MQKSSLHLFDFLNRCTYILDQKYSVFFFLIFKKVVWNDVIPFSKRKSDDELLWHISTMFFSAKWSDTFLISWVNNVPGPYLIARDNFYIPNRVHDNIFLTLSEIDIHPFRLNTFVNVAN